MRRPRRLLALGIAASAVLIAVEPAVAAKAPKATAPRAVNFSQGVGGITGLPWMWKEPPWAYVVQNQFDLPEMARLIGPLAASSVRASLDQSIAIVAVHTQAPGCTYTGKLDVQRVTVGMERGERTVNLLGWLEPQPPAPPGGARACVQPSPVYRVALVPRAQVGGLLQRWTLRFKPNPGIPSDGLPARSTGPVLTHLGRAIEDRPDETSKPRIHFSYVIPADVRDDQLDVNGTIRDMIRDTQSLIRVATEGRVFRVDKRGGAPDVTFVRLRATSEQLQQAADASAAHAPDEASRKQWAFGGIFSAVRDELQQRRIIELRGNRANVVLFGSNLTAKFDNCGAGDGATRFALIWASGLCLSPRVIAHEVMHALGFVSDCAPHASGGHVTDSEFDLMGGEGTVLDVGNDDYYKTGRADCPDLDRSPYLIPG